MQVLMIKGSTLAVGVFYCVYAHVCAVSKCTSDMSAHDGVLRICVSAIPRTLPTIIATLKIYCQTSFLETGSFLSNYT